MPNVNVEKSLVVSTLNIDKVANINLADKRGRKGLAWLAALREYERVELELQQWRAEKKLHTKPTQMMVLTLSSNRVSGSKAKYKMHETVEGHYIVFAMKVVREISIGATADVSELNHDCKS